MTERTPSVPASQAEVPPPDAERPAGLSADPIPEAAVQAAEQAAAEAEEKARTEAASTLKALVRAYRAGERSYRAGLLEAGRLADVYLHQRMDLGDKRAAAVQAVEGQLAAHASSTVDVNRLVGTFHAYRLLCEEPGLKADVPYGHYRDCWCLLVERQHKDSPQELWALLPGLEQEARELFARAAADGLSKAAVQEAVSGLVRQHAARQAEEAAKAQAAADAEARARLEAERKALAEAARAKQEAEAKAREAAEAKAGQKPQAEEEARQAEEEARRREEEARQAEQERQRAEAEARRAAEEAERKEAARARQEAKAQRRAAREADRGGRREPAPAEAPCRAENLLAQSRHATVKDAAEFAAGVVNGHPQPDDVLEELLSRLAASAQLSGRGKRACRAALVVLTRKEGPSPAELAAALAPSGNGPVAVVA
jgi:hypothetical protein